MNSIFLSKMSLFRCLLLSAIFAVNVMASCKKEKAETKTELEKLPAKTQEGKNTFGCLFEETAWTPHNVVTFGIPPALSVSYDETGYLIITCNRRSVDNTNFDNMNIAIHGIVAEGSYSIQKNIGDTIIVMTANPIRKFRDNDTGIFKITKLDKINRYVSGEFNFDLADANNINPSNTITKVTEGRFDLKY